MHFTSFFNRVIGVVSEVTEISRNEILSKSREQEVVDARCLLIYILYRMYNLSFKQIGHLINRSGENVSYHAHNFECRKSQNQILKIQYEITAKKIQENKQLYS